MKHALALMLIVGLICPLAALAQTGPMMPGMQPGMMPGMAPAASQPPAPPTLGPGKGVVSLTWDEFVKITGYDPSKKGAQVLTIPWSEVENLLGVELKGKVPMAATMVDLPWTDFKALLEWSVRKKEIQPPVPTDYIVTSCQYTGTLGPDSAEMILKLKLNVLRKEGWKQIPVLPANVALKDSTLTKGVYVNAQEGGYQLLTETSGEIEATLTFDVAVTKSSGIYSVGFGRLLAGPCLLDLKSEGEAMTIKVPAAQSQVTKTEGKAVHVAAALASNVPINITWERAIPKPEAVPSKLYAETKTLAAVSEGVFLCQETVDFSILYTPVREVRLSVPAGVSVLEVSGGNLQDWRVDKDGTLVVVPRGEVIGPWSLRVSYEQTAADNTPVAVLRPLNVERERGYVGVVALANVEIEPGQVAGATVIDVKQLPPEIAAMTKQPILLAFRYIGGKSSIPLVIRKHGEVSGLVMIVDSALFTTMQLDDGRRMTRVIYTVRNNRSQFLRATMPAGADIWSVAVGGNTVSPGSDDGKRLLIPLIRSAASAQELTSFPVELVYVETPKAPAPAAGKLHVELPTMEAPTPTIHVMVNFYAPAEGKYERPGGLFSPPKNGFSGPLNLVNAFTSMTTDKGAEVIIRNAPQQAQQMQQQFETRMENDAKAAGVTPIRVRLPLEGKMFRLEKILALPGDQLYFDVEYSDWKVSK